MDLQRLSPIIEQTIKQVLSEKRYPFGFANNRGLSDKVASGKLRNSIKAVQTEQDTIVVYGPGGKPLNQTYGDWGGKGDVNLGRKAGLKGVPISALEEWITARGLKGRDKKGRFITKKSFAFAIQTNIKKFGIKPSNFIELSIEALENNAKLFEEIEKITLDEIIDIIEGI
jgi:hypothetical protein